MHHRRTWWAAWSISLFLVTLVMTLSVIGDPRRFVLEGNWAFGRGDFVAATIGYLRADANPVAPGRIRYDLGNVYLALGEREAARDTLDEALEFASPLTGSTDAGDTAVLHRAAFNLGNLAYRRGDYRQAVELYIVSLRARPDASAAKINLELALARAERGQPESVVPSVPVDATTDSNSASLQLLEYLQRREVVLWADANESQPTVSW